MEERNAQEVLEFQGISISKPKVKGFYPAFDLASPELISVFITTAGIEKGSNRKKGSGKIVSR